MNYLEMVLYIAGGLITMSGAVAVIIGIAKAINASHDRIQKYDGYEKEIENAKKISQERAEKGTKELEKKIDEVKKNTEDTLNQIQTETEAKLQDIKSEQCMLTYCMMATLDGLHQLGCNGKVTEARCALDKYMNKQAHNVE